MDKKFPKVGDLVKFDKPWALVTGEEIPVGTFGQIVYIDFQPGYDIDKFQGMYLGVGVYFGHIPVVLKINYLERSDVLAIIPDTPASKVLFGKSDG